jgi:3-isopropylmalate/(R)-2-methylmalate dehydratase small subunit
MHPFVQHRGRLALLDWSDVNTDVIIPARYLKRIERTGFGPLLFADKRYAPGRAPDPDAPERHGPPAAEFPLNNPAAAGATVLVVGHNFGCGSSREHAVWAIMQAGYRAVIAPRGDAPGKAADGSPSSGSREPGFADIFRSNALGNGLLAIDLDEPDWRRIAQAAKRNPEGAEITIDLRDQTVTLHDPQTGASPSPAGEERFRFEISAAHRSRLLAGLDAIAETLLHDPEIRRHEDKLAAWIHVAAVPHQPREAE